MKQDRDSKRSPENYCLPASTLLIMLIMLLACMDQLNGRVIPSYRSTSYRRVNRTTSPEAGNLNIFTSSDKACNLKTEIEKPYFGNLFHAVYLKYGPIHGYVSIFVCFIGITVNVITVAILTR